MTMGSKLKMVGTGTGTGTGTGFARWFLQQRRTLSSEIKKWENDSPRLSIVEEDEGAQKIARIMKENANATAKQRSGFLRRSFPGGVTNRQVFKALFALKNSVELSVGLYNWAYKNRDMEVHCAMALNLFRCREDAAAHRYVQNAVVHESKPYHARGDAFRTLASHYVAFRSRPHVFYSLVTAYLRAMKLNQALDVYKRVRKLPLEILSALLEAMAMSKGAMECVMLYRDMVSSAAMEPNSKCLNTVMGALCREDDMVGAMGLLADMEEKLLADSTTYTTALEGLCKEGTVEDAMLLLARMLQNGDRADLRTYKAVVSLLCKHDKVYEAEGLLSQVLLEGLPPDASMYCAIINSYCERGDVDRVIGLYEEMARHDLFPDQICRDNIVMAMCQKGHIEKAEDFLKSMGKMGFVRSHSAFKSMICSYCRQGNFEAALNVQKQMANANFHPDLDIYKAFIELFQRRGDAAKANELVEEAVSIGVMPKTATCELVK